MQVDFDSKVQKRLVIKLGLKSTLKAEANQLKTILQGVAIKVHSRYSKKNHKTLLLQKMRGHLASVKHLKLSNQECLQLFCQL